jgi:hypothetical protein
MYATDRVLRSVCTLLFCNSFTDKLGSYYVLVQDHTYVNLIQK